MTSRRGLGLILPFAVVIGLLCHGCTEGELIRVQVPAAPCARPPDPDLRTIRPLWGRHRLLDAVWAGPDLAMAVGTGGYVMTWDGGNWHAEESGTSGTLRAVAARADGEACAVGPEGILIRRRAGSWTATAVPGVGAMHRLAVDGEDFWACGEAGSLVRVTVAGVEAVEPPHRGDLQDVFASGDSLWVLDGTDTLRVAVDGAWHDVAPPRLSGKPVVSLAALPDGRLVAMADSLYVREAAGWRSPSWQLWNDWNDQGTHLRLVADELWYLGFLGDSGGCGTGRLILEADEWSIDYYCDDIIAPRDRDHVLVINGDNLRWITDEYRSDPAGTGHGSQFVHLLDDGTFAHTSDIGFESGTSVGMAFVAPSPDIYYRYIQAITGRSLTDYWVVTNSHDQLLRVRQHESEVIPMELPDSRVLSAAVQANEDLFLFTQDAGVLLWREGALETLDEGVQYTMHAAGPSQIIATRAFTDDVYILEGSRITATGLDRGFRAGGFLPDGRPVFLAERARVDGRNYGAGMWSLVWETGADSLSVYRAGYAEECGGLNVKGAATGSDGFYIWTVGASLVYRLAGDPGHNDWELVAGPFESEIRDLAVQPDGSLIAEVGDRIVWHPGRP